MPYEPHAAIYQNRLHLNNLAKLQLQASSGLKYSRPSDNPLEVNQIETRKRAIAQLVSQQGQINRAENQLNASVSNLLEANNLINRGKQIAISSPGLLTDAERKVLAGEIDTLVNRLAAYANASNDNQFLYATLWEGNVASGCRRYPPIPVFLPARLLH